MHHYISEIYFFIKYKMNDMGVLGYHKFLFSKISQHTSIKCSFINSISQFTIFVQKFYLVLLSSLCFLIKGKEATKNRIPEMAMKPGQKM